MPDDIAKKYSKLKVGTQAQSRFTKAMQLFHPVTGEGEVSGEYSTTYSGYPKEDIYYPQNISYGELNRAIHHEDIHAALRGLDPLLMKIMGNMPRSFGESFWGFYPQNSLARAKAEAQRSGSTDLEMPAYLGAWNPQQMPVDEELRQRYLSHLMQSLPSDRAALVQRIMQSAASIK